MAFILIKPHHLLNLEQIVEVEYTPESSGIDDETGAPYVSRSRLEITTTALELEASLGYEGDFDGCASRSKTILLRGDEADRVWKVLTDPKAKITELRP